MHRRKIESLREEKIKCELKSAFWRSIKNQFAKFSHPSRHRRLQKQICRRLPCWATRMSRCLSLRTNDSWLLGTWSEGNSPWHPALHYRAVSVAINHTVVQLQIFFFLPLNYSLLNDNQLGRIKSDGLFGRLPNLVKLDLRRNQISGIEPQAFDGALKIQEMLMSENKMTEVHNKMFMGLHNLKTL